MKAVGFLTSHPIEHEDALLDIELPDPAPRPHDLLVRIEAISVNPADAKRRIRTAPGKVLDEPFILGYDAVGRVEAMGADVEGFVVGDRVWYAGDAGRPGSNAELQCVDARIAAKAPSLVAPEAAASLPLTAITAWEMLFDRLQVPTDERNASLLVIGGAGGVGSATIQLARVLTGLTVLATASREDSADWCRKLGAHEVIDHRDLVASTRATGHTFVNTIVQYADLAQHWDAMAELIAPQGRIGSIVETSEKIDVTALQGKSAALMWELMFTRSMYETADMHRQGMILARVARLVDDGLIKTTETRTLHGLSAATLKEAHRLIETASTIGKLVVRY